MILSGIATASLLGLLSWWGRGLIHAGAPLGILSFEMIWDAEGLARVVGPWGESGRRLAVLVTWIDFPFIAAYVATSILLVRWKSPHKVALFQKAAFAAGAADVLENLLGLLILSGTSPDPVIFLMSLFATVKFLLLAVVVGSLFC